MQMRSSLLILLIALCISSCKKSTSDSQVSFPPTAPVIITAVSRTDVVEHDTLPLVIYFTDVNNDFVNQNHQLVDSDVNLQITDNRIGYTFGYIIGNSFRYLREFGNSGVFTLLYFPDCIPGKLIDTMTLTIQLTDTTGLKSNKVTIKPIVIHCQ